MTPDLNKTIFQSRLDEVVFEDKTVREILKESYTQISEDRKRAVDILDSLVSAATSKAENEENPASIVAMLPTITEYMKRLEKTNEHLLKFVSELEKLLASQIIEDDYGIEDYNMSGDAVDEENLFDMQEDYVEEEFTQEDHINKELATNNE